MKTKLSVNQARVIKLLKKGWELGVDRNTIGFTVITRTARLQKHGLGHGDPIEEAKIGTIEALERKGLIKMLPNPYVMMQPTRYVLTEKGKELEIP